MSEREESRDILIELRSDMKHIRQTVDNFRQSDAKQWEKIDALGQKTEGHEKSISFLTKGFWVTFTAVVTGVVGIVVFVVNHRTS